MRGIRRIVLVAGVGTACAAGVVSWSQDRNGIAVASATSADNGSGHEAREQALRHKLALLDRLMPELAHPRGAGDAGDETARELLREARWVRAEAERMLSVGSMEEAEVLADQALKMAATARRRVQEPGRDPVRTRSHYEQLHARVISYVEAYDRIVAQNEKEEQVLPLDRAALEQRLRTAEERAHIGDLTAGASLLDDLSLQLERALSILQHEKTLTHRLEFATPAQEYRYEMKRNSGYVNLLNRVATGQKGRPTGRVDRITRLLTDNSRMRAEAAALAAGGRMEAAVQQLEQASELLVHALRTHGVSL